MEAIGLRLVVTLVLLRRAEETRLIKVTSKKKLNGLHVVVSAAMMIWSNQRERMDNMKNRGSTKKKWKL